MVTTERKRTRRVALLAALALLVVGLVGPGPQAGAQGGTATITAVHGVRGLVADVYLDGTLVLPGFQPERATDPLTVPAGTHRIDVRKAGDPLTAAPLVSSTFDTPAGRRASVLVHLGSDGGPQITLFDDDVAPIPPGQVRLVLRHGAAAGPVDLLLDGLPLVKALANPTQFVSNQGASPHELTVTVAGQAAPASGPQRLDLQAGTSYTFYLIGSAGTSSLGWIVSRIDGLGPMPLMVQTGSGGSPRAADPAAGGTPVMLLLLVGVAGTALVLGGGVAVRRRLVVDARATPKG